MITALSTPEAGRIILDGNNTVIKIQSTNGEGYYFRAKIAIDGQLFDEQGWSRVDAFTATKDLKKLYNAYFTPQFVAAFANGLTEQTHLKRLVSIIVEEYSHTTGTVVQSIQLPSFYILYNVVPEAFNDQDKVLLLGMRAPVMVVPFDGKITFPFYVNATNDNVSVKLVSNHGTVINQQELAAVTGKKIYQYRFDLSTLTFNFNTLYFVATVSCGNQQVSIMYRVNRLPNYPVREIAFRNNFGYYIYAYLDGQLELENTFSINTYENYQGADVIYEITEDTNYTINSGSFKENEKLILNMLTTTLDSRMKVNGQWLTMVTKTKKQLEFRDRQHQYSENLSFTLKKGQDVSNVGMIEVTGTYPDIYITGWEDGGVTSQNGNKRILIYFTFNNGFSTESLTIQWKTSPAAAWTNSTGGIDSPRELWVPSGTYYIRLQQASNPLKVSNDIQVVI